MREYYVTYRTPAGALEERRVEARNHNAAVQPLAEAGCEIVDVRRVDDEDADTGRRVGSPAKSAAIAILLAAIAAGIGVAILWWRKG